MKIKTTFCQHCKTARFDSNLDGRCRFCNAPLYEAAVELPELSDIEKQKAKQYLKDNRPIAWSIN